MAKKSRTHKRTPDPQTTEGEVGPRQPCPCGSGKRYKACHGSPDGPGAVYVGRPFEGLPGEADIIAMRELVPSATAPLTLTGDTGLAAGRSVLLCSLLPAAAPAMVRDSGDIWLGLQVMHGFGDPSRDLAAVLTAAVAQSAAGDSGVVGLVDDPGAGQRLQDLLNQDTLEVTVHDGFDFWIADVPDKDELSGALDQANEAAAPTARLTTVEAAYWTRMGSKEHLRWVMPEPEGDLLDALARLHVAGRDVIVPEARLVGMFRAHGLLAPVWDLAVGTGVEALEEPAEAFKKALDEAMAESATLTGDERSARSGLANRQVTIR